MHNIIVILFYVRALMFISPSGMLIPTYIDYYNSLLYYSVGMRINLETSHIFFP